MVPRANPGATMLVGLLLALAGRATAATAPAASAASEPCGASSAGMLRHAACLLAAAAVTPGWREHVHAVQRLRGGGAVELTGARFPALTHKQMRAHMPYVVHAPTRVGSARLLAHAAPCRAGVTDSWSEPRTCCSVG